MDTNNNIQKAKNVPPFVRYCSAIIPTMFDDSLSYYEALCALNNFLQTNVIDTINNNATVTEEYIALTNELKDFVENYFENLDVQEEINNKLDEMAEDGTLGTILRVYVDNDIAQQNERISAVENDVTALKNSYGSPLMASTVAGMTNQNRIYVYIGSETGYTFGHWYYWNGEAWTSGGVYQSSAYTTDKTLELAGTPADAQYTGLLKNDMNEAQREILSAIDNTWFNPNTGLYPYNAKMLGTNKPVSFSDYVSVEVPTSGGYTIGAYVQNEDESWTTIGFGNWQVTLVPNKNYVLQVRHSDTTQNIYPIDALNLNIRFGGSLVSAQLLKGDITSLTIDANYLNSDNAVYWIQSNQSGLTQQNFPVSNTSGILYNFAKYRLASSANTYYQQFYYENSRSELYYRIVRADNHSEHKPWKRILPSPESVWKGKKLSIYGDSISTYTGWIPAGNLTYYTGSNAGVTSVNQTWWKRTIDSLQFDLLVNNSWSGRTVSSRWDGPAGYKQSNIDQLGTEENDPDVIIVKLGINDFNNNVVLGDYDGTSAYDNDPSKFANAYGIMLHGIMTKFKNAKVYCCTLTKEVKSGFGTNPTVNGNGDSLEDYNNRIRAIANSFGAEIIDHANCGITEYNMATVAGDYNSETGAGLHPNATGMGLIANSTIEKLDSEIRNRY